MITTQAQSPQHSSPTLSTVRPLSSKWSLHRYNLHPVHHQLCPCHQNDHYTGTISTTFTTNSVNSQTLNCHLNDHYTGTISTSFTTNSVYIQTLVIKMFTTQVQTPQHSRPTLSTSSFYNNTVQVESQALTSFVIVPILKDNPPTIPPRPHDTNQIHLQQNTTILSHKHCQYPDPHHPRM